MDPIAHADSGHDTARLSIAAIRLAVNIAQCECVCTLHLCFCLLTDTGEKAGIQPFLYGQV